MPLGWEYLILKLNLHSIKLTLILGMIISLILSFVFGGWLSIWVLKSKLYDDYSQHRIELTARVANTLVDPISNFSPLSGRLVIEAIKQDPDVVMIHVFDDTNDMNFVKINMPSRASVQSFENFADVLKEGQTIGRLNIIYNDHRITQDIAKNKRLIILIFGSVFLATLLIMYPFMSVVLFKPLDKLSNQAENFKSNELEQPSSWRGSDEISVVGQTLESARHSIRNLISELEERGEAYKILSETDRLTGLVNRYKLDLSLNAEARRARRFNKPFGIILIDIDYFKCVNDMYGHHIGDQVLIQFSHVLKTSTRESDVAGRWGGEEFLVISPEANLEGMYTLAEKIRTNVEATQFLGVGQKTISLGYTIYQEKEEISHLISRADIALYEAKNKGRNCVVMAPD
ncbi:diguanylate cyclase [Neptunomonas sp.]|uniref:diguanylate cyclase n=1 Tax=Neptunomonas sp. TaxID=1971898 RepID=UPI00356955E3